MVAEEEAVGRGEGMEGTAGERGGEDEDEAIELVLLMLMGGVAVAIESGES